MDIETIKNRLLYYGFRTKRTEYKYYSEFENTIIEIGKISLMIYHRYSTEYKKIKSISFNKLNDKRLGKILSDWR